MSWNGKYICFEMANIFVLKWQIYLFGFWQILFLKLGRSCFFRISYSKEVVWLLLLYIKDFFLRYLQSFKFRYYCRWTFGYRLYVFSCGFFVYRLYWELYDENENASEDFSSFYFGLRWLFTYFGSLSLALVHFQTY